MSSNKYDTKKYDFKYGINENGKTRSFHRSRQMFCIKDGEIFAARKNVSYTHAVWFEKMGWMNEKDDSFMKKTVRGFIDSEKNIWFYVGYDMKITKTAEKEFFKFLDDIVKKFKLTCSSKIFGGMIKSEPGTRWPPQKSFGTVEDYID